MNKAELIDAISSRVGDRRTASNAVEALLATVQRTVQRGERVTLSGFGVFEKVDRAARTARNPATGEAVHLAATSVPRFRPGQAFKDVISGARPVTEELEEPAPPARATRGRAAVPAAAPRRRATALTAGVPVAPGATEPAPEVEPEAAGTAAAAPAPRARAARKAPAAAPTPTTVADRAPDKAKGKAAKPEAAKPESKPDSKKAKKDDAKPAGKKAGKGEDKKGKKR